MLNKKAYLASRLACGLGNSLYGMVFIWWLQNQTKSSSIVGICNAIFSVTAALSIFYGPIIDRQSYKKVSIYSMLIQVILLFGLTYVILFSPYNYLLAIVIASVLSICDEFFSPTDRAILSEAILNEDEMTKIISKVNIVDQLVNVGGTALSGALLVFLLSGQIMLVCSFLSLIGLIFLNIALRKIPDSANNLSNKKSQKGSVVASYVYSITSGYQYIRKNKFLRRYLWAGVLYSFAQPALMLVLPRVAQEAGNASLYGTFYIMILLGIILGAMIAGKMKAKIKTIGLAWLLSSIPIGLMLLFKSNLIAFCILLFLFGPVTSIHNVLAESIIQTTTPDDYLARVFTTIRTTAYIGGPISSVLAGLLLDHTGSEVIILISSLLILIGGINILLIKEA